jgi:hypothetical protein
VSRDLWRLGAAGVVAVLFVVALLLPLRAFAVPSGLVEVCSASATTSDGPVNIAAGCSSPFVYFTASLVCSGSNVLMESGVYDESSPGAGDWTFYPSNYAEPDCGWFGFPAGAPSGLSLQWFGIPSSEGGGATSEVHLLPFYMSFEEAGQVSAAILALWLAAAGWRWLYSVLWGSSAPESE